jgi:hypothetical protein
LRKARGTYRYLQHFAQPFDADEAPIDYSNGEEEDEQETPASVEQEASASVEQETSPSVATITSGFGSISLGDKDLTQFNTETIYGGDEEECFRCRLAEATEELQ